MLGQLLDHPIDSLAVQGRLRSEKHAQVPVIGVR